MTKRNCRVCLRKCRTFIELRSLFREEHPQLDFFSIFNICTRLGATRNDYLPQLLCSACGNHLITSFNFLQQALEADEKLRRIVDVDRRSIILSEDNELAIDSSISASTNDIFHGTASSESVCTNALVDMEMCDWSRDPLEDTDDNEDCEQNYSALCDKGKDSSSRDNEVIDNREDFVEEDNTLKEFFSSTMEQNNRKVQKSTTLNPHCSARDAPLNKTEDTDKSEEVINKDGANSMQSLQSELFPEGHYKCEICRKQYFTSEGLKAHHAVHMTENKKIKKSPLKKKISDDHTKKDENKKKQYSRLAKRIPKEADCNVNLLETNKNQVKNKEQKPPKTKKVYPCEVCGKNTTSASQLRYHMTMHTGRKDYLCSVCPKAFSIISALNLHMRIHTGEKPYECKFCGDKFTRPSIFQTHMRRHTGERPYGCDICGKRFAQRSTMTTHMKINHLDKKIHCPHCDKKYARPNDLRIHMLSHTGDKPFPCQLCPVRFVRRTYLNRHMKQQHQNKESSHQKGEIEVPKEEITNLTTSEQKCTNSTIAGNYLPSLAIDNEKPS